MLAFLKLFLSPLLTLMFKFEDLCCDDQILFKAKYSGQKHSTNNFACSCSRISSCFFDALTYSRTPIGFIVCSAYHIINTIEYANGDDPKLLLLRSKRFGVFDFDNCIIVCIEEESIDTNSFIDIIYSCFEPENIFIFSSSHYCTNFVTSHNIPKGFTIQGIPAAFFTLSHDCQHKNFTLIHVEESNESYSIQFVSDNFFSYVISEENQKYDQKELIEHSLHNLKVLFANKSLL